MEELLKDSPSIFIPEPGTIVDGAVITIHKNRILVDLGGVSTGIISGKEAVDSADTIKELEPGDDVAALVLEPENDEGLVVLSLRKASQHRTWHRFVDIYENKETIQVKIAEANKGGLLVEADGVKGFIPVSQLAPMHYPRVNGADSAKILARLQKLVGLKIDCRIINIDSDTRKLILSEKEAQEDQRKAALSGVKIGEVVDGKISGVVNFGIFVTFNGLEGLVHISEIAWGHVSDPSLFGKLGDDVKIKIIGIEGEKISLSIKQLSENPWDAIASKFEIGQTVMGKVNRITEYGAFIGLEGEINGLIHVSEVGEEGDADKVAEMFKIGQEIEAKIINIDTENHRIGLTVEGAKSAKTATSKPTVTEVVEAAPVEEAAAEEKPKKKVAAKPKAKKEEAPAEGLDSLGVSAKVVASLTAGGFDSLDKLKGASEDDLTALAGVGPATVKKILAAVK